MKKPMAAALSQMAQIERRLCEKSLTTYLRQAWHILNPSEAFVSNWHIDLIAEYLYACSLGQITRLAINVPPKSTKSTLVSVMWPTWWWGPQNHAGTKWMFASYSDRVSTRDSLGRRTLITSQWYQNHWGRRIALLPEQNQKTLFQNSARGHMMATTMSGQGTGLGCNYLIVDDPHDTENVVSDKERNRTLHNFDHKLSTRLDNPKTDVIVTIAQRLHTRDLTGHLLDGPDGKRWEHLCIPMEAPARTTYIFPLSKKELTREEGALLNPSREGPAELEEHLARLGQYGYQAQFQQKPLPPGGGIFKISYFKLWPRLDREGNEQLEDLPEFTSVVQSWDTALKANETNSFSVSTTWRICNFGYFLVHVFRKHLEFPDMMHAMQELANEHKPDAILVEDKASGQSAIQELRRTTLPVIPIHVDADKVARARAAAPTAEAGKLWILRHASWTRAYLDELTNFPKVDFSDQVDSTTQFINWARQSGFGTRAYRKDSPEVIREKIERGYICGYPGCLKPMMPNVPYIQTRGLKFCCQDHAW